MSTGGMDQGDTGTGPTPDDGSSGSGGGGETALENRGEIAPENRGESAPDDGDAAVLWGGDAAAPGDRGVPAQADPSHAGTVVVHVTGAVRNPGVYTLPAGSRIDDAIALASGLTGDAREAALNRAEVLADGQQVYVPSIDDEIPPPGSPQGASGTPGPGAAGPGGGALESGPAGTVNVNTASATELESLHGIGPALAQRIVDYRTRHGPFTSAESLTDVSGIGPRTLERFRDEIVW